MVIGGCGSAGKSKYPTSFLFQIEKCNKFRLLGMCPLRKDNTHQTRCIAAMAQEKLRSCGFGIRSFDFSIN